VRHCTVTLQKFLLQCCVFQTTLWQKLLASDCIHVTNDFCYDPWHPHVTAIAYSQSWTSASVFSILQSILSGSEPKKGLVPCDRTPLLEQTLTISQMIFYGGSLTKNWTKNNCEPFSQLLAPKFRHSHYCKKNLFKFWKLMCGHWCINQVLTQVKLILDVQWLCTSKANPKYALSSPHVKFEQLSMFFLHCQQLEEEAIEDPETPLRQATMNVSATWFL
jgi:hypothetical protein